MTGEAFIAMKAAISGSASPEKVRTLMERLDINPLVSCGRMNALEQQKLSILSVFMQTHEVLLLDEPAAHLNEEKARGKTVFMTSHVLEEVQRICDVIGIIRKGRLAVVQPSASLEYTRQKVYHVTFETNAEAGAFAQEWEAAVEVIRNRVIVAIPASPQVLLKTLARYHVKDLVGGRESLEESFLRYYGDDVV
jgi:ABC-2 type transport system ATP-binding protein